MKCHVLSKNNEVEGVRFDFKNEKIREEMTYFSKVFWLKFFSNSSNQLLFKHVFNVINTMRLYFFRFLFF